MADCSILKLGYFCAEVQVTLYRLSYSVFLRRAHQCMIERLSCVCSSFCSNISVAVLALSACTSLKTPPKEIVHQGMAATIAYLRRLATGSVNCRKTKLMLVGLGGAGKTRYAMLFGKNCF